MKRSSAELKRMAREMLNGRYGTPMGAFLVASIIPAVLMFPFTRMFQNSQSTSQAIIYYLASFIVMMITMVFSVGLLRIHLNIARNLPYKFSDMFWGFSHHPEKYMLAALRLYVLAILCILPMMLAMILSIILDSILLFILGILLAIGSMVAAFYIALTYSLILYLLVDAPEAKIGDAFLESKRLMNGNRGRCFYLSLSFIGWSLLGVASCYIGFLWIAPYMSQTMANFYLDVTGAFDYQKNSTPDTNPPVQPAQQDTVNSATQPVQQDTGNTEAQPVQQDTGNTEAQPVQSDIKKIDNEDIFDEF